MKSYISRKLPLETRITDQSFEGPVVAEGGEDTGALFQGAVVAGWLAGR
jgi:hypothetical protein